MFKKRKRIAGYGAVVDAYATQGSSLTAKMLSHSGLRLVYYHRPLRRLSTGCLSIVRPAYDLQKQALAENQPVLRVFPNTVPTSKLKFAREIEVGTIISWPDGRIWAATGIINNRRASHQLAFQVSTGLPLPVEDKRVSPARQQHATAVAIAVVASTCGLPLPPYPAFTDSHGRSARDLAQEVGLDRFLKGWLKNSGRAA